jgi:hypothetical protein
MNVHPILLNVKLPERGECGLALVQPRVPLEPSAEAGFRITQLERVNSTNAIGLIAEYLRTHQGQHYDHPHFILFPELSITEEGLVELEDYVRTRAPHNTIIIAGIEGLSWNAYESLLDRSDNPEEARFKPPVGTVDWVNCQIICVREDDGASKLYVQSKFRHSHLEQPQGRVLEGQDLLLFSLQLTEQRDFSFISLICADLIIQDNAGSPLAQALEELRAYATKNKINLEIIFGLLLNRSLEAEPFPTVIANTFNADHSQLDLQDTALVLVNCASASNDGSQEFGQSCLIFHRTSWKIFRSSDTAPRWYTADDWHGTHRFTLQENTSAIHTFYYQPVSSVSRNASADRLPFKDFDCKKITVSGIEDNPSSGLHIQWEKLLHQSQAFKNAQTSCPRIPNLEAAVRATVKQSENELLLVSVDRLKQISDLLFQDHRSHPKNYNSWTCHEHGEAMTFVVTVSGLLKTLGHATSFDGMLLSTMTVNNKSSIAVVDGENAVGYGVMKANYLRKLDNQKLSIYPTIVFLTRTKTVPVDVAESAAATIFDTQALADPDIPDPKKMFFSPAEPRFSFFAHLQTWTEMTTSEEALTHIKTYVGEI